MNAELPRTVIVVSHAAPPQEHAGAARIEGFTRYLPEYGWRPVVVTSRFAGAGRVAGAKTIRLPEPLSFYRRLRARSGVEPRQPDQARGVRRLVLQGAVPDVHVGWVPAAARAATRAARTGGASVLFSSSPSESSHLAAAAAARLSALPWVAEFRDGWTVHGLRVLRENGLRRRIEAGLEKRVAGRASALVGVTRPIAADLSSRFGSGHWIPNGYDDGPLPDCAVREARELLDPEFLNLVYTGTFARSSATRSPGALAAAMSRLSGETPDGRPVRLSLAGRLLPEEEACFRGARNVRLLGHRPQPVALALQRLADGLIVVTAPGEPAVATGKLLEYLGAGRPIVALAEGNDAAALVSELKAGIAVPPGDPNAVAEAIRSVARGEVERPTLEASPTLARFHRRALAGELAALLERVAGDEAD